MALERRGIPHTDISIVAHKTENVDRLNDRNRNGIDDTTEATTGGAAVGAGLGGAAGLLAGLGVVAIPGIGPVVAAGWLASTALGASVGGLAGGIVGALVQGGTSNEEAQVYAEGLRRGGTLVSVRVPDEKRAEVEAVLTGGAVDINSRTRDYRASGWNRFDPKLPPMTDREIDREHTRNR